MSCESKLKKVAEAANQIGISQVASKTAGLLKKGIALPGEALKQVKQWARELLNTESQQSEPVDYKQLPQLKQQETILPTTPPKEATCAECGASDQKAGAWYSLANKHYCADCASAEAKKTGLKLAVEATTVTTGPKLMNTEFGEKKKAAKLKNSHTISAPGSKIRLKEESVDVLIADAEGKRPRLVRLDKAFAVLDGNRPTGMAITPAGVVGQASKEWAITHQDTGLMMTTSFDTLSEATGMVTLLAHLDWNKPFEAMPQADLEAAANIIDMYKAALSKRKGNAEMKTWREQDLTGKLVNDGLGDLVVVKEDNGEKLILQGPEGEYAMPRNMVQAPTDDDYESNKLAQAFEPQPNSQCAGCKQVGGSGLIGEMWLRIANTHYCENCSPNILKTTGYTTIE